jgi:hypothetical protein
MANSLMELYGGGMVGNRTNYQLGGRVAASRRRREFAGEQRELREAAERAAERKQRAGLLGSVGSVLGGIAGAALAPATGGLSLALATGLGSGLGRAAGESTYKREDFGGGKYARETRKELGEAEDDFRRGIGERALITGIQSALSPSFFQKGATGLGEASNFLRGLPEAVEAGKEMGLGTLQSLQEYAGDFAAFNPSGVARAAVLPEMVGSPAPTMTSTPTPRNIVSDNVDFLSDGFGLSTSQMPNTLIEDSNISSLPEQDNFDAYAAMGGFGPFQMRGGGLINMMPQYQYGGFVKEAEKERFDAMNIPTSFTDPTDEMRQPSMNLPNTTFGPSAPPAPLVPSYGTATDVQGALTQLGMTDVALDPRLQQFMGDLPDFQMGYAQQIGDIYSGAQQAARGMRAQQRQSAGQRGFAGSGIGQRQAQQAFGDLRSDVARQRRGVVEGFQADLLSAIGDIERKGEFEFGTSPEALGARAQNVISSFRDTLAQQGITVPNQPAVPTTPEEQEMADYFDSIYG